MCWLVGGKNGTGNPGSKFLKLCIKMCVPILKHVEKLAMYSRGTKSLAFLVS